jgi:DMSO/TMAO reductase YedYZ molybdopterin-dependent catalytic subunit
MTNKKVGNMKRKFLTIILIIVFSLIFSGFLFFGNNSEKEKDYVEIQEYKGAKLGSIEDFRENSIKGVQTVDPETYRLEITGLVSKPMSYTLEELKAFTRKEKVVELHCVEGWSVNALWEGISLMELFEASNPATNVNTIIFHAQDGYTTSLELRFIRENNIIIADRINGVALPAETGFPFQLVAEQKWGYKWIRWITKIELTNDGTFRGYWESHGYNNIGDLSGPKNEPKWDANEPSTPVFK